MKGKVYMWKGYERKRIYKFYELKDFINDLLEADLPIVVNNGIAYYNVPSSFDIETSSFRIGEQKAGCMYIWQFGIDGFKIYGRKWREFFELLDNIDRKLYLNKNKRIIIYCHFLGFEFQWICKRFKWDKVFSVGSREPVQAISGGFEFRCSYLLSNYSLEFVGKNLTKYKCEKLVGLLDYSLLRTPETELTQEELDYSLTDIDVVMNYIQEEIEQYGEIYNIPLTNTGRVRNFCRDMCFNFNKTDEDEKIKQHYHYLNIMKNLIIYNADEYFQLNRAFRGGFTHASCMFSNSSKQLYIENVGSADIASSYPFVMIAEYMPMSSAKKVVPKSVDELYGYLKKYCCLFDLRLEHVKPIKEFENYIPSHKCNHSEKCITNNGRIVSAEWIEITITELDFDIIERFYTWEEATVKNFKIYEKGYLPVEMITAILYLYGNKTALKNIPEKIVEYLVSKNMINSTFGMAVTAIIREMFLYLENGWCKSYDDAENIIKKYNKNKNRFLYYPWGVWITAHARHNLFEAIEEFGEDYVYADTDSIKGINFDKHKKFFENYNQKVYQKLIKMCNHYNIPFSYVKPKTKKGVAKLIGVFEMEETYKKFKTVGAKRYIYTYEDGFTTLTASGIRKYKVMPYLIKKYNNISDEDFTHLLKAYEDVTKGNEGWKEQKEWIIKQNYNYDMIYAHFGEGMYIPAEYSGTSTITYIDKPISAYVTDYLGKTALINEKSCVHSEEEAYLMSITKEYLDYLKGIRKIEK